LCELDEPITDEPMTDEPMTDEPMTDEPMTDEPDHRVVRVQQAGRSLLQQ
jgi:hypothetical protein